MIEDIPDLDGPSSVAHNLNSLNLGDGSQGNTEGEIPGDIPDIDDIPDMEEAGLEGEEEDVAAAKPAVTTVT